MYIVKLNAIILPQMAGKVQLSVVIPIFNESMNIITLYDRLKKTIGQKDLNVEVIYVMMEAQMNP